MHMHAQARFYIQTDTTDTHSHTNVMHVLRQIKRITHIELMPTHTCAHTHTQSHMAVNTHTHTRNLTWLHTNKHTDTKSHTVTNTHNHYTHTNTTVTH